MAADCKSAAPCGLRRFESSPVHKGVRQGLTLGDRLPGLAHVAQMVERVLGKDEVTSSILVVGSKRRGDRPNAKDWAWGDRPVVRRSPKATYRNDPDGGPDAKNWAGVTQWLESRPSKPLVAGSNPVSRSSKLKGDLLELNRRRRYGEREV